MKRRMYNQAEVLREMIRKREMMLSRLGMSTYVKDCCNIEMSKEMVDCMIKLCKQEIAELEKQFEEL